jgi:hypothetical protein
MSKRKRARSIKARSAAKTRSRAAPRKSAAHQRTRANSKQARVCAGSGSSSSARRHYLYTENFVLHLFRSPTTTSPVAMLTPRPWPGASRSVNSRVRPIAGLRRARRWQGDRAHPGGRLALRATIGGFIPPDPFVVAPSTRPVPSPRRLPKPTRRRARPSGRDAVAQHGGHVVDRGLHHHIPSLPTTPRFRVIVGGVIFPGRLPPVTASMSFPASSPSAPASVS